MDSSPIAAFLGDVPVNYDKYLGPFLFEPYALDLVQRIGRYSEGPVLELACGTGRVTRHLAGLIKGKGKLIATDLNEDMLTVAREKLPYQNLQWQAVDAQALPFNDDHFSAVVCQFGVMFFPDKLAAFKEAYRVLQPGGLFLFNTWDDLAHNSASDIIQKVLREVLKDEAPDFMEKGPFSFYQEDQIKQLLEQAGFTKVRIEKVMKTGRTESVENIVEGFTKGSPLYAYLSGKDANTQQEVMNQLRNELSKQYGERDLQIPMQALVCSAIK